MVKMRNFHWTFLIITFFATVVSVPLVSATASTTLSVEPPSIQDVTLGPGATFSINIKVTDVVDLYGYDFRLQYNTAVLTATSITVGPFFPQSYVWKNVIDDTAGFMRYAVGLPLGTPTGISGSGVLATITFSVDLYGESMLDLYNTKLGDSSANPIPHAINDGYFSNWPAGTLPSDVYIGLTTAFVGNRHLKITKDGNTQTLTAQIENMGKVPASARARFNVLGLGGPIPGGELKSAISHLLPGETLRLSVPLDVTPLDRPAEYTVEVWVEYYGFTGWITGHHGGADAAKTTAALSFKLED